MIFRGYMPSFRRANVIEVAKYGGDYKTITDAVDRANDSNTNPKTIILHPGTYLESVNIGGARNISLVGVNKHFCIIKDDSGQYANAPLEIEGPAYVANLSLISTHDNDLVTAVDSLRSYAVHADYDGAGTTEFFNCIMRSYQNAAFGSGMHQDQTLKLIGCELYSHTPLASTMTTNGSLFVHNSVPSGVANQKLIVKDCLIKSDKSYAAYINDANKSVGDSLGNDMKASFYNNILYSVELGKTGIIHKEVANASCYSGSIILTADSFGNNLPELNVT